jgi:radical SAM protein with 4Fe4S-binding SPASM domain
LKNSFLSLSPTAYLKRLEFPAVYKKDTDELYELGEEAFEFLKSCHGNEFIENLTQKEQEFVNYCLQENILVKHPKVKKTLLKVGENETPSLRYLLVNLTERCNLKCHHCYLGDSRNQDLSTNTLLKVFDEFDEMGGLRLIVSGGEPLLHPNFELINQALKNRTFRTILNTNATLLNAEKASSLFFDEIQISLDGLKHGHESLRGPGTFEKAVKGIEFAKQAGKDVSVATMVHAQNINEFDKLESLLKRHGVSSWSIDVPVVEGRLAENKSLLPPLDQTLKKIFEKQFGAEVHQSNGDYVCGAHLGAIQSNGKLTKCGFYEDWTGGNVSIGLREAWKKLPKMKLSELACDCPYLCNCRGGCRFRAEVYNKGNRQGADPVRCLLYEVNPKIGQPSQKRRE